MALHPRTFRQDRQTKIQEAKEKAEREREERRLAELKRDKMQAAKEGVYEILADKFNGTLPPSVKQVVTLLGLFVEIMIKNDVDVDKVFVIERDLIIDHMQHEQCSDVCLAVAIMLMLEDNALEKLEEIAIVLGEVFCKTKLAWCLQLSAWDSQVPPLPLIMDTCCLPHRPHLHTVLVVSWISAALLELLDVPTLAHLGQSHPALDEVRRMKAPRIEEIRYNIHNGEVVHINWARKFGLVKSFSGKTYIVIEPEFLFVKEDEEELVSVENNVMAQRSDFLVEQLVGHSLFWDLAENIYQGQVKRSKAINVKVKLA